LIIAFAAAGALTGGAVSAAALNMPTPVPTVNVEAMALDIVDDDTQLFGTPVILTGEGETNVLLGSPPEGATDIAVAFNCVDAASYDIQVDDDDAMTITCDEKSTSRAGGASLFPIDAESDGDHRLSIATGKNDRYAVWASWASSATPPDPSPAQHEALSDGTVTENEYRDGFARYRQCMVDAGHPLLNVIDSGRIISYVNSPDAVQSGEEARCYTVEFGALDAAWQLADQ
jgi:hypothetical protein